MDISKVRLTDWDAWIAESRREREQERAQKERDRRVEIIPPSKPDQRDRMMTYGGRAGAPMGGERARSSTLRTLLRD